MGYMFLHIQNEKRRRNKREMYNSNLVRNFRLILKFKSILNLLKVEHNILNRKIVLVLIFQADMFMIFRSYFCMK